MTVSLTDLWSLLAALMVVVLPLLLAWWLVVRGAGRAQRSLRERDDNVQDRRSPH